MVGHPRVIPDVDPVEQDHGAHRVTEGLAFAFGEQAVAFESMPDRFVHQETRGSWVEQHRAGVRAQQRRLAELHQARVDLRDVLLERLGVGQLRLVRHEEGLRVGHGVAVGREKPEVEFDGSLGRGLGDLVALGADEHARQVGRPEAHVSIAEQGVALVSGAHVEDDLLPARMVELGRLFPYELGPRIPSLERPQPAVDVQVTELDRPTMEHVVAGLAVLRFGEPPERVIQPVPRAPCGQVHQLVRLEVGRVVHEPPRADLVAPERTHSHIAERVAAPIVRVLRQRPIARLEDPLLAVTGQMREVVGLLVARDAQLANGARVLFLESFGEGAGLTSIHEEPEHAAGDRMAPWARARKLRPGSDALTRKAER